MPSPAKGDPEATEVAGRASSSVARGDTAIATALSRLDQHEAPCVGIIGKSGSGKTECARHVVAEYLRRSRGIVLVIDDKEARPRYAGQLYRDTDELAVRPPKPEPRTIVLRGDMRTFVGVDHEVAGRYQHALALRGVPSLMVHDEQSDAAHYGQWKAGGKSFLKQQYVKGRALGEGKLWLSQFPGQVPDEPWSQSNYLICFSVDEQTVKRMARARWVDARLTSRLRSLPNPVGGPETRGFFLLLEPECASDGQIYRLPILQKM